MMSVVHLLKRLNPIGWIVLERESPKRDPKPFQKQNQKFETIFKTKKDHKIILKKTELYLDERKLNVTKMGGEVEMLRERISFLEEENDNLMIEKEIALTKMEQVILRAVYQQ